MRNVLWSHVSVCLSAATCLPHCTDLDVTWRSGRGCPLVVHYWVHLQLVHGLRCYGNITRMRNVSEYMLTVLTLCLVLHSVYTLSHYSSYIHESILIMFATNVPEKVGNQQVFYFATSPN